MQSSCNVVKSVIVDGSKVIAHPEIHVTKPAELNEEPRHLECDNIQSNFTEELENIEKIKVEIQTKAEEKAKNILYNAKIEADEMLKSAAKKADEILQKTGEEGYQDGYKKGYSEGYNYGIQEAENEAQRIKKEADDTLKNSMLEANSFINNSKKKIIGLSVEIAKHILNTELTINQEAVYKIAERVISSAVDKKQIILKVNTDDFNYVKNRKDELSIFIEDKDNIIIVADPTIKKGCVKGETPSGFIDGDVEAQLEIILKGLIED